MKLKLHTPGVREMEHRRRWLAQPETMAWDSKARRMVTLYLPLVTVPVTLPFALGGWVWPTAREWVLVMKLTLLTTLLYGLGLAAAIALPSAIA